MLFGRAAAALPPTLPAIAVDSLELPPSVFLELAAQAELLDEGAIALEVVFL